MTDETDAGKPISVTVPARQAAMTGATSLASAQGGEQDRQDTGRNEADRLRALRRGEGVTLGPAAIARIIEAHSLAASAVYRQVRRFGEDLAVGGFFNGIPATLPSALRGELLNPDGSPARQVLVEVLRPVYTANEGITDFSWAPRKAVTDRRGVFSVPLAPLRVPQNGLSLRLRGQNMSISLNVARADAVDGDIGLTVLDRTLTPLQRSVVGDLAGLLPVDAEDADDNVTDFRQPQPPLILGEGGCATEYRTEGGTVSRRSYSVLYRMVDPLVGPNQLTRDQLVGTNRVPTPIPGANFARAGFSASDVITALSNNEGEWNFRDRIPVQEPIDVDEYFTDLEENPHDVPKASTLGLGYITKMRTVAVNVGMSLGQLIYSLPLAPGEEQRIVITEQRQRLSVRERESLSFSEEQEFIESQDTSFQSTFDSALNELMSGSSSFDTNSDSESKGLSAGGGFFSRLFSGGIVGGIGGSKGSANSSSEGTSSASQNISRNFLSETDEAFSAALERSASVKRRSTRTGIRTATALDRQNASTKFIANRNHCHALTMQWFEVLRDFSIETRVEGVQLVCFVPLQLIRFRPRRFNGEPHPRTLPSNPLRAFLLERYDVLLRYASTLRREFRFQRRRRAALQLLEKFAADPFMEPEGASATAQDVVRFRVRGTFMANDDISATIVTLEGERIGPVPLGGSPVSIDEVFGGAARDREMLIARLADLRRNSFKTAGYEGGLALPRSVHRSDIARVEINRSTGMFAYRLDGGDDAPSTAEIIADLVKNTNKDVDLAKAARAIDRVLNTSLSAEEFDNLVGAPLLGAVEVVINEGMPDAAVLVSRDIDDGSTFLPLTLPFAVAAETPVLTRRDLTRIEEMYQHVVSNTVTYSKAVWLSMTDEERAILLERFTIGVPEGGLADASSEVALLSAVGNRVLGFYGNAMIMPFHIPVELAEEMGVTTADIQDALIRFHREDFRPRRRTLSLPTRGVLGEAVLGRCNACEIIDHRRFWNWQDSPTPPPVGDAPTLPQDTGSILAARAPADLVGGQPQNALTIAGGNIGMGSAASSSPLADVLRAAPELARGGADLTGLKELQQQLALESQSSAQGRDKAIDSATDLTKHLVTQAAALTGKTKEIAAAQKAKDEKNDADVAKQAEAARKDFADRFTSNAGALAELAGANADTTRDQYVRSLFDPFPGGIDALRDPSNVVTRARIYTAFNAVNENNLSTQNQLLGAMAFLNFLNPLGD